VDNQVGPSPKQSASTPALLKCAVPTPARITIRHRRIVVTMSSALKVMIIRHGEKPMRKHQAPYGITEDGEQDWDSLTVQGWQRAGALQGLFAPPHGPPTNSNLTQPSAIYASKRRSPGAADDDGSNSQRPLQTITPLASKLKVSPNLLFSKGDEAALVEDVLKRSGAVLVCWQHEKIFKIARHLVASSPPAQNIPSDWPDERFDLVWIFDAPSPANPRWSFVQLPEMLLQTDSHMVLS